MSKHCYPFLFLHFSFLAHKEFRFVLPVVPIAMHVCGYYITVLHQGLAAESKGLKKGSELEVVTEEQVHEQIEQVCLLDQRV